MSCVCADPVCEVRGVAAGAGRGQGGEVAGQGTDGGAGEFLRSGLLVGAERDVCLVVLAPLEVGPGDVDEQAGLAFGDGDRGGVDLAGQVDRGSGVAEATATVASAPLAMNSSAPGHGDAERAVPG